jgi:hypothetical protein
MQATLFMKSQHAAAIPSAPWFMSASMVPPRPPLVPGVSALFMTVSRAERRRRAHHGDGQRVAADATEAVSTAVAVATIAAGADPAPPVVLVACTLMVVVHHLTPGFVDQASQLDRRFAQIGPGLAAGVGFD